MKFDKIVALVPMRHHSQRVPGKNYRPLAGKPLFHHILQNLLKVQIIDQVVVDTDSEVIIEGIKKDFPTVTVILRPEELRADDVPMNEVLLYDIHQAPADLYLQTHTTNPLLQSETISSALNTIIDRYPTFDSLFSVTRVQVRMWDELTRPINHNPTILLQTQDLPPIYEENSCLYIFTPGILEARRNRLGARPYMFEINRSEAWDIDEEIDFQVADLLLSAFIKQKQG